MLSLAPIKYRNLSQTPNTFFSQQKIVIVHTPILGSFYESYVYLHDDLKPINKPQLKLYGSPDGSGTAFVKNEAYYKAISEALERMAFYAVSKSENKTKFGFDIEPSSTGMAAFPGILKCSARKNAYFEAVERWTLTAWWEKYLSHKTLALYQQNFSGIEIITPFHNVSVVILWCSVNASTLAYSFAAHANQKNAINKAKIELSRNFCVLQKYCNEDKREIHPTYFSDIHEQRLAYFASTDGQKAFAERLQFKTSQQILRPPKKIIDIEIMGPWSKYATIWRMLFEPVSNLHLQKSVDYFLF